MCVFFIFIFNVCTHTHTCNLTLHFLSFWRMKWNDAWLIRSFHMAKINRLHSVYIHPSSTIFCRLGHWGCGPTGESSLSSPSQSVQLFPVDPPNSHHSATTWPGFRCLVTCVWLRDTPLISLVKGDLWFLCLVPHLGRVCLGWPQAPELQDHEGPRSSFIHTTAMHFVVIAPPIRSWPG